MRDYLLIVNGKLFGKYYSLQTALKIAHSLKSYWQIYRGEVLVEEA